MTGLWYFFREHRRFGPVSLETLRQYVNQGIITRDTKVLLDGEDAPVEAATVAELFGGHSEEISSDASESVGGRVAPEQSRSRSPASLGDESLGLIVVLMLLGAVVGWFAGDCAGVFLGFIVGAGIGIAVAVMLSLSHTRGIESRGAYDEQTTDETSRGRWADGAARDVPGPYDQEMLEEWMQAPESAIANRDLRGEKARTLHEAAQAQKPLVIKYYGVRGTTWGVARRILPKRLFKKEGYRALYLRAFDYLSDEDRTFKVRDIELCPEKEGPHSR